MTGYRMTLAITYGENDFRLQHLRAAMAITLFMMIT